MSVNRKKKASKKKSSKKKVSSRSSSSIARAASGIRNRVKELRMVLASDLIPNENNWRLHPEGQKSALSQMLQEIGYADAAIARETDEGLQLLDGHLRAETTPDMEIPVLIVDLDDDEARKLLLTLDPLSGMAVADPLKLEPLMDEFPFDHHAELRKMIADLSKGMAKDQKEGKLDEHEVEGMALQPHEHYDFIVVLATTAQEWNMLCEKLALEPHKSRRGSLGTARALRADKLLQIIAESQE